LPSALLCDVSRRADSISVWPRHINYDSLRLFGHCRSALVRYLGQLLDGTLLDFWVLGVEQPLPHDEQIGAAMNLLDELASISGEWKFSAWYFVFFRCWVW
jgi:hypothetical protein